MKIPPRIMLSSLVGLIVFSGLACGQEAEQTGSSLTLNLSTAMESLQETIQAQKESLDMAQQQLIDQGATEAQLDVWEAQHAGAFSALLDNTKLLSAYADFQPKAYLSSVDIPESASPDMEQFLVAAAHLQNGYTQISNQLAEAQTQPISVQSAQDLAQDVDLAVEEQLGSQYRAVAALAKTVSDKQALEPMEIPPTARVPPGASALFQSYLVAASELNRAQVFVHNQHCHGTVAQLDAAMAQWRDANEARFKQVAELAHAYSQSIEESQP